MPSSRRRSICDKERTKVSRRAYAQEFSSMFSLLPPSSFHQIVFLIFFKSLKLFPSFMKSFPSRSSRFCCGDFTRNILRCLHKYARSFSQCGKVRSFTLKVKIKFKLSNKYFGFCYVKPPRKIFLNLFPEAFKRTNLPLL